MFLFVLLLRHRGLQKQLQLIKSGQADEQLKEIFQQLNQSVLIITTIIIKSKNTNKIIIIMNNDSLKNTSETETRQKQVRYNWLYFQLTNSFFLHQNPVQSPNHRKQMNRRIRMHPQASSLQ